MSTCTHTLWSCAQVCTQMCKCKLPHIHVYMDVTHECHTCVYRSTYRNIHDWMHIHKFCCTQMRRQGLSQTRGTHLGPWGCTHVSIQGARRRSLEVDGFSSAEASSSCQGLWQLWAKAEALGVLGRADHRTDQGQALAFHPPPWLPHLETGALPPLLPMGGHEDSRWKLLRTISGALQLQ